MLVTPIERTEMKKWLAFAVGLSVALSGVPAGVAGAQQSSTATDDTLPELTPAPDDALTGALDAGRVGEAEYALERALTLFRPSLVARRFGQVAPPTARSATIILRDLAVRQDDLSESDRGAADALLARPTDGGRDPFAVKYRDAKSKRSCTPDVCIHYVIKGKHKVAETDSNGNGRPDYVDTVRRVAQHEVWAHEIDEMGFREPKDDGRSSNNGGNGKLDIYLADLGGLPVALYGYCASDDPNLKFSSSYRFSDMSAYCVYDNDYRPGQFPSQTPLANLQVTAAHEFFHAVQFGYDIFEDLWILENSAVWMEDEVYPDINDNLQYLSESSMRRPFVSLDFGAGFFEYGNFIFWKHASERFGRSFTKKVWNRADGARGGPDQYSLEAVRSTIERRSAFGKVFVDFAMANFLPELYYAKGDLYEAETGGAPLAKKVTLTKSRRSTATVKRKLDHLANLYFGFKPGRGVKPGARLKIDVDGPGARSKPKATLLALNGSDVVAEKSVALNAKGIGSTRVPFGKVTRVLLILTNASTRYKKCFTDFSSPYSCAGKPVDQRKAFSLRARLKQ